MKLTYIRRTVLHQLSCFEERETVNLIRNRLWEKNIPFSIVTIQGALRFLKASGMVRNHHATWRITPAGRAALAQGGG